MRIVRTIIFILVCIGLIWLFVSLMMSAFSGGDETEVAEPVTLTTYAVTDAEAQLSMDGPVVNKEEHDGIRITVSRVQTQIEIIQGYDNKVVNQRTYANTQNSYEDFLASLDQLGFSSGLSETSTGDEQGKCPMGSRHTYTLEDGSDLIGHGWSTTCGTGTFGATRSQIKSLFIRQIPSEEYSELVSGLNVR